jgi:hypothetical protein
LNIYFLLISITLSVLAFFFVPPFNFDLIKYYNVLELSRLYGWNYITNLQDFKALPVASVYVFLISQLKYNGFLPAITSFITYSFIFQIIYRAGMRYKSSKSAMMLATVFFTFVFNYFDLISGIRNFLAFAVFAYFIYMELIEKKFKILCWIVYIGLCFFHAAMITFLILRVLLVIYNRFSGKILNILLLISSLLMPLTLSFLGKFSNIPLFELIADKSDMYIYGQQNYQSFSGWKAEFASYTIVAILFFVFICFMLLKNKEHPELVRYNKFITLLYSYTLGSINSTQLFTRAYRVLLFLSLVYVVILFKPNREFSLKIKDVLSSMKARSREYWLTFFARFAIVTESLCFIVYNFGWMIYHKVSF